MNEPTQHAQKSTGKVTARQLLAVVRQGAERLYMHAHACADRESYSDAFTFDVSAVRKDRKSGAETTSVITVPGWVANGNTSQRQEHERTDPDPYFSSKWTIYCEAYRPTRGYWPLWYSDRLRDALELLPPDAEIAFSVALDAGTSELAIRADVATSYGTERGLHVDHLYLHAWYMRGSKRRERTILLNTELSAHNSARFGSPRHERDTTGR